MRFPLPISWHLQDMCDPRIAEYIRKVLPFFVETDFPFWIKALDPPEQKPDWVLPGVSVCGRMFEADGVTWADMARGEEGAVDFFNRWIDHWLARPWVTTWNTGNEPHPPEDLNFLRQLNKFLCRLADLMHEAGLQCAGPNFSVGQPDIGHAVYLGPAVEKLDQLCLHEYGCPMWDRYPWHCGRYNMFIDELKTAGFTKIPPALLGETGIDGGVAPVHQAGTGWKTHAASEEEYVEQLVWQAKKHLDDYPTVHGAFIFTVAPWGWGWDDFIPTDTLIDKIAAAVLEGYDVEEQPKPEPPPFEILDVSDELPTHPTKEYETRDWDPDEIIIHHAGYDYPADATMEQVRAHLDVIANYHINRKDWPGIAYHYVVDGMGRIWQVNHQDTIAFHAGEQHNPYSYGICMLGAFHLETVPTDAQLHSMNCLCQWLEIPPAEILAHKQITATACPGKIARWWDKIVVPDQSCQEEEEEDMTIEVVNANGTPADMTFEEACEQFGLVYFPAAPPEGATVFRLKRIIYESSDVTNWRVYIKDKNGAPLSGHAAFLGIRPPSGEDLPDDAAPRLAPDFWQQPADYPNRAETSGENFTGLHGYIQRSLGPGSNYVAPVDGGSGGGTHWTWVMCMGPDEDPIWYTDVLGGIGMFRAHEMFWAEFWKMTGDGDGPDPDPDPEGGDYVARVPEISVMVPVVIPAFSVPVERVEEG